MTQAPGGRERFDWRDIVPRPWKNGAGLTREIACAPPGASLDDFDWRISVAEVRADGPFSAFAGIDRCIALLQGAGMRLRSADGRVDHRLVQPCAPYAFAGEAAVEATLVDGPCTDLNVMTRRNRWRVEVHTVCHAATVAGADVTLLLGVQGVWRLQDAQGCSDAAGSGSTEPTSAVTEFGPSQGLLWRRAMPPLRLRPSADAGAPCVLLVRLCHHRQP